MSTPDVRRLLAASAISSLGDGVQVAALPLAGASLTSSPATIAALAAAGSAPALLGAIPAGVLADRLPRAALLAALDLVQAAVLAVLVALTAAHALMIWQLFAAALLMGSGQMLSQISVSALVPAITPAAQLARVNGVMSTVSELGAGLAGPAAGGVLFSVFDGLPFAVNACSFAAAGLVVATLARRGRAEPGAARAGPGGGAAAGLSAGLRWLAAHRQLRGAALLTAAWSLFGWMPEAVFVLYTTEDLHAPGAAFGGLLAATAAGAIAGGLMSARLVARLGAIRLLAPALLAYAILMVPPAFLTSVYPVAVVGFLQGVPVLIFTVAAATARQALVPQNLMARVTSVFYLAGAGTAPLGLIAGGLIGSQLGLRATFIVGGAGLAASVVLASRTVSGRERRLPARAARGGRG